MKVFKFGGASVSHADAIKHVSTIIQSYSHERLLIVISAMGKTTNALEEVVSQFMQQNTPECLQLFNQIKQQHIDVAKQLLNTNYNSCLGSLLQIFTEVEWLLHDTPTQTYDYYYDQIVCTGELMSTTIISSYLNGVNIPNKWVDIRDFLRTDGNFRDAAIDWLVTADKLMKLHSQTTETIITQGFIGATDENESTTLGREGSDYTAAVIANILDAESVTIWKDVEGVMSADPKLYDTASFIPHLSYSEVIEMAYYGAQVIHPKTIKPLRNKKIPLLVKSFKQPHLSGTVINQESEQRLPPIIVKKQNQIIVQLQTKDYSFIEENLLIELYQHLGKLKIKPNLIQTSAVAVTLCIDENDVKLQHLSAALDAEFNIHVQKNLYLLTIRHYSQHAVQQVMDVNKALFVQQSPICIQAVFANHYFN